MRFKKLIGKIHLWLGLGSGLVVILLGITGCILAFETEIDLHWQPFHFVNVSFIIELRLFLRTNRNEANRFVFAER